MEPNKKFNQPVFLVIIGVCLFAALMNFTVVLGLLGDVVTLILPVIAGGILAMFINVPLCGVKRRLLWLVNGKKKKPSDKAIHALSFAITVICVILVLTLVLTLLIPEIIRSSKSLYYQIIDRLEYMEAIDFGNLVIGGFDFDINWLEDILPKVDLNKITQAVTRNTEKLLSNIAGALSSTVNVLVTSAFSLIISIYMTLGKERLIRHSKKVLFTYVKPKWAENIARFCGKFADCFSNFLSGQCTEAVILGVLMFLAFTTFNLPYGSLVGVLTAVCAIIPYVGAFISCTISVFLTLLLDPTLALRCLIVYLAVQFVENQFIYPRVVGGSVGLPPLYTLIAAMVGGKLFGIIGIIFFIPLAAVILEMVKEDVGEKS